MEYNDEIAITNLYFRTTVEEIYDAFSPFGKLVQCRMLINERGESKGYAFVKYQTSQDGQRAIHHMNNFHMNGKAINVNWSNTRAVRQQKMQQK